MGQVQRTEGSIIKYLVSFWDIFSLLSLLSGSLVSDKFFSKFILAWHGVCEGGWGGYSTYYKLCIHLQSFCDHPRFTGAHLLWAFCSSGCGLPSDTFAIKQLSLECFVIALMSLWSC